MLIASRKSLNMLMYTEHTVVIKRRRKNPSNSCTVFWSPTIDIDTAIPIWLNQSDERRVEPTCNLPSNVLCIVTHLLGCAPFVVMAVMRLSSSSLFSFSFFTKLSMALFANDSDSPPCRWHMRLCTILRQASALVGAPAMVPIVYASLTAVLMTLWSPQIRSEIVTSATPKWILMVFSVTPWMKTSV